MVVNRFLKDAMASARKDIQASKRAHVANNRHVEPFPDSQPLYNSQDVYHPKFNYVSCSYGTQDPIGWGGSAQKLEDADTQIEHDDTQQFDIDCQSSMKYLPPVPAFPDEKPDSRVTNAKKTRGAPTVSSCSIAASAANNCVTTRSRGNIVRTTLESASPSPPAPPTTTVTAFPFKLKVWPIDSIIYLD